MAGGNHSVAPLTVFGGWAIAEHTESRSADGWEVDYERLTDTVYPTVEACEAAISAMFAQSGRAAA